MYVFYVFPNKNANKPCDFVKFNYNINVHFKKGINTATDFERKLQTAFSIPMNTP
jgi:hypothetical protein